MSKYIVRMNQAKLSYESLSPEILSSKKKLFQTKGIMMVRLLITNIAKVVYSRTKKS